MSADTSWSRSWQQRLNRRRLLGGASAGLAGLAATSLVACSSNNSGNKGASKAPAGSTAAGGAATRAAGASPAGTSAAQPKKGGTVRNVLHVAAFPAGWDTHVQPSTWSLVWRLMYNGLLAYEPNTLEVSGELASKWETPSNTEYIFTLRPGVKWQNKAPANGRALKVDDIVFSLNRIRTPGAMFQNSGLLATADKIEAVDADHVRITTKTPDSAFLSKLSADAMMVMSPELLQSGAKLTTAETAIGTGAFIMNAYRPSVDAEFVRNPDYWRTPLPYLDGVHSLAFADDQASYAAFLSNQLDISPLPGSEIKGYLAKLGAGVAPPYAGQSSFVHTLQPNLRKPPFDDPRVAMALRLIPDYQQIRAALEGTWYGKMKYSVAFPSALYVWDLTDDEYGKLLAWKQPKDDAIKQANAMLSAAGYSSSKPIKFKVTFYTAGAAQVSAQLLQEQWKKATNGIVDVTLDPVEVTVGVQRQNNRDFDYFHGAGSLADLEPDGGAFRTFYYTNAPRNNCGFSNTTFDGMVDKISLEFDLNKRKGLVRDAVMWLNDNFPGQTAAEGFLLKATKSNLQGYKPESSTVQGYSYQFFSYS